MQPVEFFLRFLIGPADHDAGARHDFYMVWIAAMPGDPRLDVRIVFPRPLDGRRRGKDDLGRGRGKSED